MFWRFIGHEASHLIAPIALIVAIFVGVNGQVQNAHMSNMVNEQRVADHGRVFDRAIELSLRDPSWLTNYTYREFANPDNFPEVYLETVDWALTRLESELAYQERSVTDGTGIQTGHLRFNVLPSLAYVAHAKSATKLSGEQFGRVYDTLDLRFHNLINKAYPEYNQTHGTSLEPRFAEELSAATFILLQLENPSPDPRKWMLFTAPVTAPAVTNN